MARKPPFTVTLTDEERERIEAHRVALGLRSLADVVRHWIAEPAQPQAYIVKRQVHPSDPTPTLKPLTPDEVDAALRPGPRVPYGSLLKNR